MSSGIKLGKFRPFEFNPRGNLWYNDDNKFGQKMLSKMGWSKGKGLGKNEDGIKENVKISKKDNLTGVGFDHSIPIPQGCVEYDKVLSKLQQRFSAGKVKQSASTRKTREEWSKNSYFGRSRESFKIPEKDMKCIFLGENKKVDEPQEEKKEEETPTFKSSMSMNEYFQMKMRKKLGAKSEVNNDSETMANSNIEECRRKRKKDTQCLEGEISNQKKLKSGSAFSHKDDVSLQNDATPEEGASDVPKIETQKSETKLTKEESSDREEESKEEDRRPECLNLPKCSTSNFNFWLESQRAAMKMKMYQGMLQKMKTDSVFRTTNLLDIKGYGNW